MFDLDSVLDLICMFAEDFRLTTCVCVLKWVLKMYMHKKVKADKEDSGGEKLQRENTKYEEVTFKGQ